MALVNIIFPQYCSRRVPCALLCVIHATCKRRKCLSNISVSRALVSATTSDVLDTFTDKLVQKKADKWKYLNTHKSACQNETSVNYHQVLQDNFLSCSSDLDFNSIDELITKAVRSKEYEVIISILNYSRRKKHCPPTELLLEVASIFSRAGNKNGVQVVKLICDSLNKDEFCNQAEYKHYMAEATWVNGNVGGALDMFADVYKHHATLRRKVRNMAKFLFAECISNRSEASVVLITNFAKKFAEEYRDLYFLSCLWQFCFLSEWFCDQKMANELLEQYQELRAVIMVKMQIIAVTALKQEEVEVVHRLLEVALRYDMRQHYTHILREFFDFKCAQRDLKGCSAILASTLELNVPLRSEQHDRFLDLLLDSHNRHKQVSRSKHHHLHKTLKVPPFQLKF